MAPEKPRSCVSMKLTTTLDDCFWAFGELVPRDGYVVRAFRTKVDRPSLGECRMLMIFNAQPNSVEWGTYLYPTPTIRPGVSGCSR